MTTASTNLRLGTRGSLLAKTQSQLVASELEKRHPGLTVELVIIKTSGDNITDRPLYEIGGKGLFTKELEQALLAQQVDLAVHSFKDVPATQPLVDQSDLIIAATTEREDPRDVLVSLKARSVAELPNGAKVGTSSLRRRCQLLEKRPDLVIEPLRGNIDTRLRKVREGQHDAIILAAAGLRRAALFDDAEMVILSTDEMLPAPGQGALALQCRKSDARTRGILEALNHPQVQRCIDAERTVVAALGGDCHSPIAALAECSESEISLQVAIGARGGNPPVVRSACSASPDRPDRVVEGCLNSLSQQNVQALLSGGR